MSPRNAMQHRIYDSLASFNSVAHWDVLKLPQMRQYLAEHLMGELVPSWFPEGMAQCARDEIAHVLLMVGLSPTDWLDAYKAEDLGEAYPGELAMLRGLLGVVRTIAQHGDMDELRRVIAEHHSDEHDAYAETPAPTPAEATAAVVEDPIPPPATIEFAADGPVTIHDWRIVELAADYYGVRHWQIGGWLPDTYKFGSISCGTNRMIHADLPGSWAPTHGVNVEVEVKGYGGPQLFIKIQWPFAYDPALNRSIGGHTEGDPAATGVLEPRRAQLLFLIRQQRGKWRPSRTKRAYRKAGVHGITQHAARTDLARLHELGHLTEHGPDDGRFYCFSQKELPDA
ncbi:hypothetical protein [Streptomyces sp. NPDC096153]|uniref:hypothetical protein n=1 Tax=Streptomyces sp. NPDC096153 TaxID=3155548 RepID=UPI00331EB4F3